MSPLLRCANLPIFSLPLFIARFLPLYLSIPLSLSCYNSFSLYHTYTLSLTHTLSHSTIIVSSSLFLYPFLYIYLSIYLSAYFRHWHCSSLSHSVFNDHHKSKRRGAAQIRGRIQVKQDSNNFQLFPSYVLKSCKRLF